MECGLWAGCDHCAGNPNGLGWVEIPIYFGGVFSIEAVRLSGVYLASAKYDAARAKATLNQIEFSKV